MELRESAIQSFVSFLIKWHMIDQQEGENGCESGTLNKFLQIF